MSEVVEENKNPEKLDFKRILPIFVIVLVDLLGLTIIIPLLPLYAAAFGANAVMIGIIGTAYPAMQLMGSPLLGSLSDRFGRKPVLIVSQIGTFLGFIMLGFANAIPILILSRIIDGLSGANIVTAQAAITDSTTDETRAQGLGLIGAAFGLGFVIGPAIAGLSLAFTNNDYRVPAFIAAAFSLLSILLTTFMFEETLSDENREAQKSDESGSFFDKFMRAMTNPLVSVLLIFMFMQRLVFGGFEQLLPLFTLSRLGLDGAGNAFLYIFVGIILVVMQGGLIGPLTRRFGEVKLIYAGLGLVGIGLIMISLTPEIPVNWYDRQEMIESFGDTAEIGGEGITQEIEIPLPDDVNKGWFGLAWILVAMIPTSIGGGLLSPGLNSLITQRSLSADAGGVLGISAALVSGANTITPLIGGTLFQFLGSTAPFLIGGIILVVLLVFATQLVKNEKLDTISIPI